VEDWAGRNKKISTLEELVRCYYTDIKIICIPSLKSRSSTPSFLLQQYSRVHKEIVIATDKTRESRRKAELLLNSQELNSYFGYAFDHFSGNEEKPFDFLTAAFTHNPVQGSFTAHIVKAATELMTRGTFESSSEVFKGLAPFVASSILLEVCRNKLPQQSTYL
jgi:hypothetical protein